MKLLLVSSCLLAVAAAVSVSGKTDRTLTCTWNPNCIESCDGLAAGDYASCQGCGVYASCGPAGRMFDGRLCPGGTVWDDNDKRCEFESSTCASISLGKTFSRMVAEERGLGDIIGCIFGGDCSCDWN